MITFNIFGTAVTVKVPVKVVEQFITTVLTNRPYWEHGYLSVEDVRRYLSGDVDSALLDKIAYYVLMWCENCMFSTYLLMLATEQSTAEEYKKWALEKLEILRSIHRKVKNSEDLKEKYEHTMKLVSTAVELGLDPL